MEQFIIEGYSTIYILEKYDRGRGTMLIVKDKLLTSCLDKYCITDEIEIFCIELNIQKKVAVFCYYNPNKLLLKHHLFQTESEIKFYSKTPENLIILGDFNTEIYDFNMESFCTRNNFKCIIKETTCYKNPDNLTCIDLSLTNCPINFQELSTLETGLSDFHKMVLTVFKSEAPKSKSETPRVVSYQKYKHLDNDKFKVEVSDSLFMPDPSPMGYKNFENTIIDSLNKHAPFKRKY